MNADHKIYHIFHANTTFHNFGFISSFVHYFGKRNFFILSACNTKELADKYRTFFEELEFDQYLLLDEDISHAPFYLKTLIQKKRVNALEYKLYTFLLSNRDKVYLLHGDFLSTLGKLYLIARRVKVNYVCWGCNAGFMSSRYMRTRTKILYKAFSDIVCLMEPELKIIGYFLSKNQSVRKISYFDSLTYLTKNEINETVPNESPRIILGNSGRCIKDYDKLLTGMDLDQIEASISCMVNYGATEADISIFEVKWNKYIETGKIALLKDIVPQEDYVKNMNTFDVYASPMVGQSGLGAIYTCMLLGKKIYISGTNHEFILGLGGVVSPIEKLDDDLKTNNIFLNEDEVLLNREIVNTMLNNDKLAQQWDAFFDKIAVNV